MTLDIKFPINWTTYNTTTIDYNGTNFSINSNGEMIINGSIKDAVLGLIHYVIDKEYCNGITNWQINHALSIDFNESGWIIKSLGEHEPDFFEEFSKEFYRAIKMKVFW
jgi:hypothetical protein